MCRILVLIHIEILKKSAKMLNCGFITIWSKFKNNIAWLQIVIDYCNFSGMIIIIKLDTRGGIEMFLLFFFVWIVFNGRITAEIVTIGILVSVAVFAFFCKFMDYSIKKELLLYKRGVFFLGYLYLLMKEIVKANLAVTHLILTQKEELEPMIVTFKTKLKSETAKVMLANSITLTPGTITVSMEEDELVVHCLDKSLAEGIEDSCFVKVLEKMERSQR